MSVEIHNIPVGIGDCLLVRSDNHNILIDCGKYNAAVKKTFNDNNIKSLDMVVVTHIDNDHIAGLIDLLQDESIKVKNVLFNGFHHIPLQDSNRPKYEPSEELIRLLKTHNDYFNHTPKIENEVSAKEALSLSSIIRANGIPWNAPINGERASTDHHLTFEYEDMKISVVSPDDNALIDTYKDYRRYIYSNLHYKLDNDLKEDILNSLYDYAVSNEAITIDEYQISHFIGIDRNNVIQWSDLDVKTDSSISNCASLAFILEIEGKRILMLGDSNPDTVFLGLGKLSITSDRKFDAIKVSHHGSAFNITNKLLSIIDSPIYIFSGGGKNKPSKEAISKIITRPTDNNRTLYFNRVNDIVNKFDIAEELKSTFNFSIELNTQIIKL